MRPEVVLKEARHFEVTALERLILDKYELDKSVYKKVKSVSFLLIKKSTFLIVLPMKG